MADTRTSSGALAPISYVRHYTLPQLVDVQRKLDAALSLTRGTTQASLLTQAGCLLAECINDIEVEVLS